MTNVDHELKCWPEQFQAIVNGHKTHEVRYAPDRVFNPGESVYLREWDPATEAYTGRAFLVQVLWVTRPGSFGLPSHVYCFSIRPL